MLSVVDAHAEGESGKVVVGGVGPVPGETMFDKMLHFSGQLFRHESIIGSQFDARIEATTTVESYKAVIQSKSGRAWITSLNQVVLDPSDPYQVGYVVGKPWEPVY